MRELVKELGYRDTDLNLAVDVSFCKSIAKNIAYIDMLKVA